MTSLKVKSTKNTKATSVNAGGGGSGGDGVGTKKTPASKIPETPPATGKRSQNDSYAMNRYCTTAQTHELTALGRLARPLYSNN
ncbi:hypothetical protein LTR10_009193 [Elasticomyces elasticus]|nr:hypothetical protein LTR10_009193 [Elasticomyces elasticus]KAK4971705.1 hypothetical protein LTR42_007433 [Elasticomyces elasticus]